MKTKETFEFEMPIHTGDKVWMCDNNGFGSCNFLERYKQYSQYTVKNVYVKLNTNTGEFEITYSVEGKDYGYVYKEGSVAFTKEQLYEKFRNEVETLIPQEMRDYLWKNNDSEYFKITDAIKVLRKTFGKRENSSTFNDSLRNAIEALEDVKKYY